MKEPPVLATRILEVLLPGRNRPEILGDLAEHHRYLVRARGRRTADLWYWRQSLTTPIWLWREEGEGTMTRMSEHARQTVRRLARSPGFTVVTVVTLALGMGATTAVYSVVDGVLLEALPFPEADRLVSVSHAAPGLGLARMPNATGAHLVYREESRSLDEMALYAVYTHTLVGHGEPARVKVGVVTPSLFPVLRIDAARGRVFSEAEGRPAGAPVVIVSHGFWQEVLGRDPDVLGRTVRLDGVQREIVGVMPPGFAFPDPSVRLWVPLRIEPDPSHFGGFNHEGIGRLGDGVTREQARRDLQSLVPAVGERFGINSFIEDGDLTVQVTSYRDKVVGHVRPALWILLGTVGFVLLIACANVANLMLVRAEGRRRESAVRAALGAGRGHRVAEVLTETGVLVAAGTTSGLVLAWQGLGLFRAFGPESLPRIEAVSIDLSVIAFTVSVAALTCLVFGSIPLFRHRRLPAAEVLRAGSRRATADRRANWVRNGLVVAQVALAALLLTGSGLMVRSFQRLLRVDPGFRAENVLTFRVALPSRDYPGARELADFHLETLDALERVPGVRVAGLSSRIPLEGPMALNAVTPRRRLSTPDHTPPLVQVRSATEGFFRALNIPVRRGRGLERADAEEATGAALISERVAELYLPDRDPLQAEIVPWTEDSDDAPWFKVVGIVGEVRDVSLQIEPTGTVYLPLRTPAGDNVAWLSRQVDYVIRTDVSPTSVVPAVRRAVGSVDPDVPLAAVRTMESVLWDARSRTVFSMLMLGVAAAVGLLLGAVGLYGVISYVTAWRTREIGVRIALGARATAVRGMVLRQGLAVTAVGLALGLTGAALSTRFLEAMLYEVSTTDPLTFLAVAVVLSSVSAVAVWIPARRASRVDVVEALRAE